MGILIKDKESNDMFTIPIYKDEKKTGNAITQVIKFPPDMGISGIVFKTEEIYICNEASQDRKFSNDIDNLSSLQDLYRKSLCRNPLCLNPSWNVRNFGH